MSSSKRTAQIGDIVLLQQGIGVIRYHGEVDFDEDEEYFGVELKGPQITGGHNGTYNGKKYFVTRGGDGRGIFIRRPQILRIISSEEILEKLAEIYDILKGRRGHSHFIDRQSYNDLEEEHHNLQSKYNDKEQELTDLQLDLSLLKEQISMMKGTLGDKIEETAKMSERNNYMTEKIQKAEDQLGSRLSQTNLNHVAKILQSEQQQPSITNSNNNEPQPSQLSGYSPPDLNGNANKPKSRHTKQRSSTTIELDQLQDNFSEIARSVQAYGQKDMALSGPHHYRKFSNTTKQIMEQHKTAGVKVGQYGGMNGNYNNQFNNNSSSSTNKATPGHRARGSMKIGDIVDEDGIDFDSDDNDNEQSQSQQQQQQQRQPKTRASRESRQLDGDEVNQGDYFDGDEFGDAEERSSHSDPSPTEDDNDNAPKRQPKTRASRESQVIADIEDINDDEIDQEPPKRTTKTRQSRESRQMDDIDVMDDDDGIDEDGGVPDEQYQPRRGSIELNDNQQEIVVTVSNGITTNGGMNGTSTKRHKARGSFTLEDPIINDQILNASDLTSDILEAHNEANNDNTENQKSGHSKNMSMTSDSSAYRAFMSVD